MYRKKERKIKDLYFSVPFFSFSFTTRKYNSFEEINYFVLPNSEQSHYDSEQLEYGESNLELHNGLKQFEFGTPNLTLHYGLEQLDTESHLAL